MDFTAFIDYLTFEKRFSPLTVASYSLDLEQFGQFLEKEYSIKDIAEVNHPIIRSWIVQLLEQQLSPRSVNRKISTLKTYYKYLLQQKKVTANPMLRIVSPKVSKRLPVFVEKVKMDKLLDEHLFPEGFDGMRDKMLIEVFYATGMRLSELINLKVQDIDLYNSTLKVLGKRNKERSIPITLDLQKKIKTYLAEREKTAPADENLFLDKKGKKLNPKFVYSKINKYLSEVTTVEKRSPHVLRHTFATHMLDNGAEMNAIKEILGHAGLNATQVYTHNTIEKLKNVYKNAHPKA